MGWDYVKVLEDRIDRLEEKISDIAVKLEAPSSIIKSIQRGTASGDADGNATVEIDEINPEKTIVFLLGEYYPGGGTNDYSRYGIKLGELNPTSFTVVGANHHVYDGYYDRHYYSGFSFSYQVIEFW